MSVSTYKSPFHGTLDNLRKLHKDALDREASGRPESIHGSAASLGRRVIEEGEMIKREIAFVTLHRVKLFKTTPKRVRAILESSGASLNNIGRAHQMVGQYGLETAFDHGVIYGRDKIPLMLVGHVYRVYVNGEWCLEDSDMNTIEFLRSIGLTVELGGVPFYVAGSYQVVLFSKDYTP